MIIIRNYFHGTTYALRCAPRRLQALLTEEGHGARVPILRRVRKALCPYGPLECRCGDTLGARNGYLGRGEYAYQTTDGRRHLDAEAASQMDLSTDQHNHEEVAS